MSDSDEYPRSIILKLLDGIGVFFILVLFALPIMFWPGLPDRIPSHFNILGEPDSWGGKGNLFIAPVIGLIVFGLISLASGSTIANYPVTITEENAERQYALSRMFGTALKVWIAVMLAYIEWMMIRIAGGNAQNLGWFAAIFPIGIIIIIAVYIMKAFQIKRKCYITNIL